MRTAALIIFGLFIATGCAPPSYLARVNGDKLTSEDLKQEFKRHHFALEKLLIEESEVRKYLDQVVDRKLLLQEAYRIDLETQPDIVEAVAEFEDRRLVQLILKREIEEKAKPTDEEVKAAYELTGQTLELRQIVVATREEAEAVRAQLEAGAAFDELAREKSIARSRRNGGKLFPTGWGAKDEAWEQAAFALAEGQLSPVFKSNEGWEILKLEARKSGDKPPFDKASHFLRAVLERRKTAAREREFLGELWTRYAARLADCDRSLAALKKALADRSEVVCATWQGGTLTHGAFAARVNLEALSQVPPDQQAEMTKTALEDLVYERLLRLEARARGYPALPEIAEPVKRHREELMEARLFDQHVYRGVTVTDEEVKKQFEEHRAEYVSAEKRHVAQILAESPEAAAEVKTRLAAGESFEALAKAYSKDPRNADKGGVVGWIDTQGMPEAFRPVFAIGEGEVTEPVKSEQGYHLVKVLGIRPARPLELAEVDKDIRAKLLQGKFDARKAAWVAELRKAADIEVNDRAVRKYVQDHDWRRNPKAAAPKAARATQAGKPAGKAPPESGASPADSKTGAQEAVAPAAVSPAPAAEQAPPAARSP